MTEMVRAAIYIGGAWLLSSLFMDSDEGETIEGPVKKPGRPKGSKNKPKSSKPAPAADEGKQ